MNKCFSKNKSSKFEMMPLCVLLVIQCGHALEVIVQAPDLLARLPKRAEQLLIRAAGLWGPPSSSRVWRPERPDVFPGPDPADWARAVHLLLEFHRLLPNDPLGQPLLDFCRRVAFPVAAHACTSDVRFYQTAIAPS